MDLRETDEQRAFREEVRTWLRANVPDPALPPPTSREAFDAHVEFEQTLYEAGYAAIRWPEEYGGRGADAIEQAIFEEEYMLAGGPERVTVVGHNLLGPTLMAHGTDEQRARWLPDILAARTIWVQGYSEPEAGSDLAAIRTRARREGDEFVVDGQKTWTSHGPYGDWVFALVRTDPDGRKHHGITFLAIDLDSPGVEVRPITQPDGGQGFAEVFFDGVRVPADQVIGEVDNGWNVAMTALEHERDVPAASPSKYCREVDDLVELARRVGRFDDPVVADRLAGLAVRAETYRLHAMRAISRLANDRPLGPASSVTKLLWSELERDIYDTGLELLAEQADRVAPDGLDDPAGWWSRYWFARAATVYAGTTEIQRTILARHVLGLPRG